MVQARRAETFRNESRIDAIGWRILEELQRDARLSMAELGRRVGLSAPAVHERVRRLERAGVITGYGAHVDLAGVGRPLQAFLRIAGTVKIKDEVAAVAKGMPEVLECHRGTGSDCIILKVAVTDIPHLEAVTDCFTRFGRLTVSVVLSSPIPQRPVEPLTARRSGA